MSATTNRPTFKRRKGTPFDQFVAQASKQSPVVLTEAERRVQAAGALKHANDLRQSAAQIKRDLRALPRQQAWETAAGLLTDCPRHVEHIVLHVFLAAIPGFGDERVRSTCQGARVWPLKRLGDLGPKERRNLAKRVLRGGFMP